MAGLGGSWGSREEFLHPRDKHGRFRKKWKMAAGVIDAISNFLDSFSPRTFQSDGQAGQYLFNRAKPGRFGGGTQYSRLHADYDEAQEHLRSGDLDAPTQKFVKMMDDSAVNLDSEVILSRTMGPEAFGLTPETMNLEDGGLEDFTGRLIADRGYSAANIGTPMSHGPGKVTMSIAVPKGTKAIIPARSPGDRGIFLDRDQEVRVTKVQSDGRGGWYMMAVATPRTPGQTPEPIDRGPRGVGLTPQEREARVLRGQQMQAKREGIRTDAEINAEEIAQGTQQAKAQQPAELPPAQGPPNAPAPAAPATPDEPPPRNEPVVHQALGGPDLQGKGTAEIAQTPTTPEAPTPQAPTPEVPAPPTPDIRRAVREADIPSPSEGPRRREWNNAYLGVASGKKHPEDMLRELESDISKNRHLQEDDKKTGRQDPHLADDIKAQDQLADAIAKEYGLQRSKQETPAKKAAPSVAKKATPPASGSKDVRARDAALGAIDRLIEQFNDNPEANREKGLRGAGTLIDTLKAQRERIASGAFHPRDFEDALQRRMLVEGSGSTLAKGITEEINKLSGQLDDLGFPNAGVPQKKLKLSTGAPEAPPVKKAAPSAPETPNAEAFPETTPGSGKVRMLQLRPGVPILVEQGPNGKWRPATKKTGATKINVQEVNRVTGRGGQRQVVGVDDQGKRVEVESRAGVQTFFLGNTPAKKAATPAIKKAAPVKAAPASGSDILAQLNATDADNVPTLNREQAAELVAPLRKAQLLEIAREISVPGATRKTVPELKREIVDATVGRRLDSIATRGFTGPRPDQPGRGRLPGPSTSAAQAPGRNYSAHDGRDVTDEEERDFTKLPLTKQQEILTRLRGSSDRLREHPYGTQPDANLKLSPEREREIRLAVEEAAGRVGLPRSNGQYVMLKELREDLKDRFPRAEVDAVIQRLNRTGEWQALPESNQKILTPRDRLAAVILGNQDKHVLGIKKPAARDTTPAEPNAPAAQKSIQAPDRKDAFTEAWSRFPALNDPPNTAAGRSIKEVRDDVTSGKITPDEGIRRLEVDIDLNKSDLAEIEQELRGDLSTEDRARLTADRMKLRKDIGSQEAASKFMRDHFRKAPAITPEEVKIQLSPEAGRMIQAADPADIREAAKIGGFGDLKGDTKEELLQDLLKKMAAKELASRAAKKTAPKKLAPAPLVTKKSGDPDYVDARAIAEGIGMTDEDSGILAGIQAKLDGTATQRPMTPAAVGRDLEKLANGPGGPAYKAAVISGVNSDNMTPELQARHDSAMQQHARWMALAERLQKTRRRPARKATEPAPEKPKLTTEEKKVTAQAAEVLGVPKEQLQKQALAKKVAAAPAPEAAKSAVEQMRTMQSREEGQAFLKNRTKAELQEIAKASDVPFASRDTKAQLTDAIVNQNIQGRLTHAAYLRTTKPVTTAPGAEASPASAPSLEDMSPAELANLEGQLGIKRTSLDRGDRIAAIRARQADQAKAATVTRSLPASGRKWNWEAIADDGAVMHGDSTSMNLAQKLRKAGREEDAQYVADMRYRISNSGGDHSPDDVEKMMADLHSMMEAENDPSLKDAYQRALREIDAPKTAAPSIPESTPPVLRKMMDELNKIPVARKSGHFAGVTKKVSAVNRLAELLNKVAAGDGGSAGTVESEIRNILRSFHESVDGAYQMWRLDSLTESPEIRAWVRSFYPKS